MSKANGTSKDNGAKNRDLRRLLGNRAKENMIAIVSRNQAAFLLARDMIQHGESLQERHPEYYLVWQAICDYYDRHQQLPPSEELMLTEIEGILDDDPSLLNDKERANLTTLVADIIYKSPIPDIGDDDNIVIIGWMTKILRAFLEEEIGFRLHTTVMRGGMMVRDVPEALRQVVARADIVASAASEKAPVLFTPDWDTKEHIPLRSTGMPVLDNFLGGGQRAGETYSFMGPYGSCKTTLCLHSVAAALEQCVTTKAEGHHEIVVLVSTEAGRSEIQQRLLAVMAVIPRKVLATMHSLKGLHGPGHPLADYEKKHFAKALALGENVPSERERVERWAEIANQHLLFLDYSQSAEGQTRGADGMAEIARDIRHNLRQMGNPLLHSVWIDHAAALADTMILGHGLDSREMVHVLRRIPQGASRLIAKPFKCPVWIVHQLNGESNSRSPTAKVHHTDADWCKAFDMYTDFAIQTGPTTQGDVQLAVFDCTKHRREPPRRRAVVKLIGRFGFIKDVSRDYFVDDTIRQIVNRHDLKEVKGFDDERPGRGKKSKEKAVAVDPTAVEANVNV